MEDKQLTKHFKLSEFTYSDTAIKKKLDNTPTDKEIENLKKLCEKVLEPIRLKWGGAIKVTSGYRSEIVNKAVNGSKTSAHLYGCAADIRSTDRTKNLDLWNLIRRMIDKGEIETDHIIWEKGKSIPQWIHVAIHCDKRPYMKNRIMYQK